MLIAYVPILGLMMLKFRTVMDLNKDIIKIFIKELYLSSYSE